MLRFLPPQNRRSTKSGAIGQQLRRRAQCRGIPDLLAPVAGETLVAVETGD